MKIQFDKPPIAADVSNEVLVSYPSGKRPLPRWRWYLLVAMILAVPLFFIIRFVMAIAVQSSPAIVIMEQIVMRAPLSGKVQFLTEEQVTAKRGQVVARLVSANNGENAANASAVTTALANEAARREGLRNMLALNLQQLAIFQDRLRLLDVLHRQRAATRQEVEAVHLQCLQTEEKIAGIRGDLARDEAKRLAPASATQVIEMTVPKEATVIKCFSSQGDWVAAGDYLLALQTSKEPLIQAFLSPADVNYAVLGQRAKLLFMNGQRLDAVVEQIMSEAQRLPEGRISALFTETPAIVVLLKPLTPLPPALQVHRLPLDVHFKPNWLRWLTRWF